MAVALLPYIAIFIGLPGERFRIMDKTLWLDIQQNRYFAIPTDADIPAGELTLHRLNGETRAVSAAAVAPWQVTGDDISPYLAADVGVHMLQKAGISPEFESLPDLWRKQDKLQELSLDDIIAVMTYMSDENEPLPGPERLAAIKAQAQMLGIGGDIETWLGMLRMVYLQLADRTQVDMVLAKLRTTSEGIAQLQEAEHAGDATAVVNALQAMLSNLSLANADSATAAEPWVNQITPGIAAPDAPFQLVGQFLREDGWNPQQIDDNIYGMGYEGRNGRFVCFAGVREELHVLVFYAVAPENAPPELLPAIYEFTVLANFGLYLGNFEVDPRDGEIRFRSSVDFQDDRLTPALIRNTIYAAVAMMDRYLPALTDILANGRAVAEAVAAVEND